MKCRARYARGCVNWAIKMTLKTSALLPLPGDAAKNTVAWAKTTRESNASLSKGREAIHLLRTSVGLCKKTWRMRLEVIMKWEPNRMWRQQV